MSPYDPHPLGSRVVRPKGPRSGDTTRGRGWGKETRKRRVERMKGEFPDLTVVSSLSHFLHFSSFLRVSLTTFTRPSERREEEVRRVRVESRDPWKGAGTRPYHPLFLGSSFSLFTRFPRHSRRYEGSRRTVPRPSLRRVAPSAPVCDA